jgi:hypothetical protein
VRLPCVCLQPFSAHVERKKIIENGSGSFCKKCSVESNQIMNENNGEHGTVKKVVITSIPDWMRELPFNEIILNRSDPTLLLIMLGRGKKKAEHYCETP